MRFTLWQFLRQSLRSEAMTHQSRPVYSWLQCVLASLAMQAAFQAQAGFAWGQDGGQRNPETQFIEFLKQSQTVLVDTTTKLEAIEQKDILAQAKKLEEEQLLSSVKLTKWVWPFLLKEIVHGEENLCSFHIVPAFHVPWDLQTKNGQTTLNVALTAGGSDILSGQFVSNQRDNFLILALPQSTWSTWRPLNDGGKDLGLSDKTTWFWVICDEIVPLTIKDKKSIDSQAIIPLDLNPTLGAGLFAASSRIELKCILGSSKVNLNSKIFRLPRGEGSVVEMSRRLLGREGVPKGLQFYGPAAPAAVAGGGAKTVASKPGEIPDTPAAEVKKAATDREAEEKKAASKRVSDEKSAAATFKIAETRFAENQPLTAEKLLKQLIERHPKTETAKKAAVLLQTRADRAKLDADEKTATDRVLLAKKSIEDKKYDAAKKYLNDVIEKYPKTPARMEADELLKSLPK